MSSVNAASVIAEVLAHWGSPCARCRTPLVGHEVVMSLILGYKGEPSCADCLAAEYGRDTEQHVRLVAAHVRRLECYSEGWRHADARSRAEGAWPHPRIPSDITMPERDEIEAPQQETTMEPEHDAEFDAGDMGCGDLVLELRLTLSDLAPGAVLRVRATDAGAPGDLPAWCRLTGHQMVHTEHPLYWIRRRAD